MGDTFSLESKPALNAKAQRTPRDAEKKLNYKNTTKLFFFTQICELLAQINQGLEVFKYQPIYLRFLYNVISDRSSKVPTRLTQDVLLVEVSGNSIVELMDSLI